MLKHNKLMAFMNTTTAQDKRLIALSDEDNVLICCRPIKANEVVMINGTEMQLSTAIGVGHKVARQAITKGEKIVRCGMPIGSATVEIALGQHVHMHNIKSDYIPSHDRHAVQGKI
ncbi:UxaA family hydrolase [Microbulbifer sp. 2304DJ12-6]|uniref:UxaA family hydrolase n=1 Tax=Microbulbifer sp. 2304DJ12-6 TaxID=3233340 RepID=UPI0039AF09BF